MKPITLTPAQLDAALGGPAPAGGTRCPTCKGEGVADPGVFLIVCWTCNGAGVVAADRQERPPAGHNAET